MTSGSLVVAEGDELLSAIATMSDALVASLGAPENWALVGIRDGGVPLVKALADAVFARTQLRPPCGYVDITLYRDDLYTGLEKPVLGDTDIPFEITGRGIVLVDDVLFTGRTVRAAMDEVWDYGRPAFIRLVVLVDRGHRELPVAADIVGLTVTTEKHDKVRVAWADRQITVVRSPG